MNSTRAQGREGHPTSTSGAVSSPVPTAPGRGGSGGTGTEKLGEGGGEEAGEGVTRGRGTGGGPRDGPARQGGAGRALTTGSPPSAMPRRRPPPRVPLRGRAAPAAAFYGPPPAVQHGDACAVVPPRPLRLSPAPAVPGEG